MKLNSVNLGYATNSIRFGNALSTQQKAQEKAIVEEMKQYEPEGISMFKFYAQALPSAPEVDTGIGHMDSLEASKMYDFAIDEYGANWFKSLPIGELTDLTDYNRGNKRPGAYDRSGLTIGADFINLQRLTTKDFGEILPKTLFNKVVEEHKNVANSNENRIDFTTSLGYKNQEYYPINDEIGVAYQNFLYKDHPSKELKALRKEFEAYKKDPFYDEIDSRTALFPLLKDWGSGKIERVYDRNAKGEILNDEKTGQPIVIYEGNPFKGMDSNPTPEQIKVYNYMKKQCKGAIDFYKFKQFLAHKCIDDAVKMVHEKGAKMAGDALMGWSWPEVQTFPDAFKWSPNGEIINAGFGKSALKYEDLLEKKDSAAHKLLRMKFENLLRHFDGVRVDMGWQYIHPKYENDPDGRLFKWSDGSSNRPGACDTIPQFIAQVARDVKGEDFDTGNILYECEANGSDFNIEDGRIAHILNTMPGRGIFATENEHQEGKGWSSLAFLRENCGIDIHKHVFEAGNQDHAGVANCANDKQLSSRQVGGMQRTFKTDEWWELKDDNDHNAHVKKYSTARFGEVDNAPNKAILINDALGRTDKIDYHTEDFNKDYKTRLERNYLENYYKTIPYGPGYVRGDVKSLKAKFNGTNNGRYGELLEMLKKIADYKRRDDGIYSEEAANSSPYGALDIASMSSDEIKHLNLSV